MQLERWITRAKCVIWSRWILCSCCYSWNNTPTCCVWSQQWLSTRRMWHHKCILTWISRRPNRHESSNGLFWNRRSSGTRLFASKSVVRSTKSWKDMGKNAPWCVNKLGIYDVIGILSSTVLQAWKKLPGSVRCCRRHRIQVKWFFITEIVQGKNEVVLWRQIVSKYQVIYYSGASFEPPNPSLSNKLRMLKDS